MPARHTETLEGVDPATLKPYPGNSKLHADAELLGSVKANGQFRPIVCRRLPDGALQILDGHGTAEAIKAAGLPVDVWVIEPEDDDEARAINVAANIIGALVGHDEVALLALLDEAAASARGLTGTGVSDDGYAALLDRVGSENPHDWQPPVDPDEQDVEPPEEPVTQLGDLWELGPHRLVCGDSTDPQTWAKLLADKAGPLTGVWTDPPYGVSYVGKTADALTIQNDDLDERALAALLRGAFDQAEAACAPGAAWYVAAPPGPLNLIFGSDLHARGVYRQTIIWAKDQFVMGRSDYHYRHEPIFYGWKPGGPHHALGDRTQDTVWDIPRPKRSGDHPTMKPVALVERALRNSTDVGALVADPFGGSGTTLIAAEATGRRARLIELGPNYCDVIVRRWAELTGGTPLRNGEPVDLIREHAHA